MKRGSGCCAVDVYRTAALTSFLNSIKLHNIFIFGMAYSDFRMHLPHDWDHRETTTLPEMGNIILQVDFRDVYSGRFR